ncbi:ribosomal protein S21 [Kwoniella shandongensis]|uniref:Ribosomal protein S21 n=1 Tax=Kwoniella shandongensis TaxID=1734106 RepID=A0A5M6CB11_9TREE|nr:ribosomal protein S21 [Kwoniella shandongensis]KAA5530962.1 ribosomal protein S21 [Kwoniella shandongensis]
MSLFFRSALRASTALPSTASTSRIATSLITLQRYNSTLPPTPPPTTSELFPSPSGSSSSSNTQSQEKTKSALSSLRFEIPSSSSSSTGTGSGSGSGSASSSSSSTDPNVEDWWTIASRRNHIGYPNTVYTGRSILVPRGGEFNTAYRRLNGLLRNGNMKKELRLGEFYEKPSVRKRRLLSERHRRRFKEMVRTKVQQVISMRSRG